MRFAAAGLLLIPMALFGCVPGNFDSEGGDPPVGDTAGGGGGGDGTGSGDGTGGGGGGDTGGGDGTAYQLCVDTINDYRATLGLGPYQRWTAAEDCSDSEAMSDSQTGQAHGAFGQCGEFAQNECPGWGGAIETVLQGCLQAMWNEGPGGGHYENMRSGGYSEAACGMHQKPDGSWWVVQNFR